MSKCLNCKEKEPVPFDPSDFKGCTMFCSIECRDEWNDNHPNETVFLDKPRVDIKKYCNKCNRLMTEYVTLEGTEWKCKKCENDK